MKTAVLINYSACNHTGKKKWLQIREKVISLLPGDTIYIPYETPFNTKNCLSRLIGEEGITSIISAGGDGSINHILNNLMEIMNGRLTGMCLGAIGLGSSNDFLKPYGLQIRGIPCRIHFEGSKLSDIGVVQYKDEKNEWRSRLFIINASLGVTADANQLFNRGDLIIRTLKSHAVDFTILYTALKTLITHKNKEIHIKENGSWNSMRFANISITKSPYISGGFHYDRCPARDSGQFGYHCAGDISRLEIIRTLMDLSKGNFQDTIKKKTLFLSQVEISSDKVMALETDGEIQLGRDFRFSTIPRAIKLAV